MGELIVMNHGIKTQSQQVKISFLINQPVLTINQKSVVRPELQNIWSFQFIYLHGRTLQK